MKITTTVLFSFIAGFGSLFSAGCASSTVGRVENFALSPISSSMSFLMKPIDDYNRKQGRSDFNDCWGEQLTVINGDSSSLIITGTSPHGHHCRLVLSPRGTPYTSTYTFILNPEEFAGSVATFTATGTRGSATFVWRSQMSCYNNGWAYSSPQAQVWEIRSDSLQ